MQSYINSRECGKYYMRVLKIAVINYSPLSIFLSWRFKALTEIINSKSDIPKETSNNNNPMPKTTFPINCSPANIKNIHSTHRKRLATPQICILRIRFTRRCRLRICPWTSLSGFSRYSACNFLTSEARVKKRLVYASNNNEMAENSNPGVVRVISCI